jgi:preprotein translocase subunit Sss1
VESHIWETEDNIKWDLEKEIAKILNEKRSFSLGCAIPSGKEYINISTKHL